MTVEGCDSGSFEQDQFKGIRRIQRKIYLHNVSTISRRFPGIGLAFISINMKDLYFCWKTTWTISGLAKIGIRFSQVLVRLLRYVNVVSIIFLKPFSKTHFFFTQNINYPYWCITPQCFFLNSFMTSNILKYNYRRFLLLDGGREHVIVKW